ncbi:MAG TPA: TRAP transporter TatT component family protein, partial [Pseudomonadota bacterium]|nr:TRAP transporter TatT component family protein [Pseudomonadota bacterium]
MILRKLSIVALLAGLSFSQAACSIRGYALRATADALSGTGGGYGTEDDPELVRDAAPFGLKTMETLAEALPDHRPIRLALASGFTQYAYVFVNQEADRAEDKNIAQAKVLWTRSRRLYLRGRNYALAALDLASPG